MGRAKIILMLGLIVMSSCNHSYRYLEGKYNLVLVINPWMKVDINKETVRIDFRGFKYVDTLIFSESEKNKIMMSFNQNKIAEIEGAKYFGHEALKVPPDVLTIKVFKMDKEMSELAIEYEYINKGLPEFGKSFNVIKFRDDVMAVLKSNRRYKKAWEICLKHQGESGNVFM